MFAFEAAIIIYACSSEINIMCFVYYFLKFKRREVFLNSFFG